MRRRQVCSIKMGESKYDRRRKNQIMYSSQNHGTLTRSMIYLVRIHAITSRWLQGHENIPKFQPAQGNCIVMNIGNTWSLTPLVHHVIFLLLRQTVKHGLIDLRRNVASRIRKLILRQINFVIRTLINQILNQRITTGRDITILWKSIILITKIISFVFHRLKDLNDRCRRVESDGIADAFRLARTVGQDEGDALFAIGFVT